MLQKQLEAWRSGHVGCGGGEPVIPKLVTEAQAYVGREPSRDARLRRLQLGSDGTGRIMQSNVFEDGLVVVEFDD